MRAVFAGQLQTRFQRRFGHPDQALSANAKQCVHIGYIVLNLRTFAVRPEKMSANSKQCIQYGHIVLNLRTFAVCSGKMSANSKKCIKTRGLEKMYPHWTHFFEFADILQKNPQIQEKVSALANFFLNLRTFFQNVRKFKKMGPMRIHFFFNLSIDLEKCLRIYGHLEQMFANSKKGVRHRHTFFEFADIFSGSHRKYSQIPNNVSVLDTLF